MTGPTPALELACLAIVLLYVFVRARSDPAPRHFFARLAILMIAAWLTEDTCIRAYGFYGYHPRWSLFIDRVPVLIVLIWPVVIHTAHDLARGLFGSRMAVVVGGALIVLADASLIEPIAVGAGLWAWTEPGMFAVPPIGIIGWAVFGCFALLVLERERAPARQLWALVVAPLGTHLALLALWWGAFRWVNGELAPWPFVGAVWALSLTLVWRAIETGVGARLPARDLYLRIPAAGFFFALLASRGGEPALFAYALAFAPPYLVMTVQRLRGRSRGFASLDVGRNRSLSPRARHSPRSNTSA